MSDPFDDSFLDRIMQIESGGNPNARTGSYKGLFQLSDQEFNRYGGGNIYDPVDNRNAAIRKLEAEREAFRDKFNKEPSPTDLYMMHQQGEAGYAAHMANPNAPAWQNMASTGEGRQKGANWARQAIWGNVPDNLKRQFGSVDNVSSADFVGLWRNKVEGGAMPSNYDTEDRTAVGLGGSRAYAPEEEAVADATGQPRGVLDMLGMKQQQQPGGLLGMLGDPETMSYIAMMLKGASPYSNLDPNAMLQNAHNVAMRKQALEQQRLEHATDNKRADLALKLNQDKFEESKISDAVKAAQDQGLKPGTPEYQQYITDYYRKKTAVQHSLTPIRGEGGKLGTIDAAGNFKIIDTGDFKPEGPTTTKDLGTSIGVFDRAGNLIREVPKDIAGAAQQKEMGTQTGKAQVGLPEALRTADQTLKEVDELIAHPGRETGTGLSAKLDPRNYIPGTDAYNFAVRAKQLEGRAFLQAYETLKGTGQITEIEGAKATQAIARMDRAQSDEEYLQALTDFKDVVNGIKTTLKKKAGVSDGAPASGNATQDALKKKYGLE